MSTTLLSTVVAPTFGVRGRLEITPIDGEELRVALHCVTRNLCGHPTTDGVLRTICHSLPLPERGFWDGQGQGLAVRPRGGVRAAAATGDTQVTIADLEAVVVFWNPI